jgi:hypothetical protein
MIARVHPGFTLLLLILASWALVFLVGLAVYLAFR